MAGPGDSDQTRHGRPTMVRLPQSRLSLVKPVYLMGIFQLLSALSIGVVGMLASSKACTLSITWIYFFNSVWFILSSSIGLSPTRRGAVTYSIKHIKKTMTWYRAMCACGVLLVCGSMTVELIGLLQESEPQDTEVWSCLTLHMVILGAGFATLLVTMGGILASTRAIIGFRRMSRDEEGDTPISAPTNTISGSLGYTNSAMVSDMFILPEYSLEADLPPTYDDVISGKADGTDERRTSDVPHQSTMDT